jgi:uncharacterized protein (TIGR02217 family)
VTFLEARISDAIMRGSRGGPTGRRIKSYVPNGRLVQIPQYSRPLQRYDISYGIRTYEDFEEIRNAYYVVMFTPYEGLRVKDWNDYIATLEKTHVVNLGGGAYQLCRRYSFGGVNFDRVISKPNADAVLRTSGGTALTATISTTTGIATGVSGGTPAGWTGTFDVPVTFEDDTLENIEWDGTIDLPLQSLPSIKLEELRL